MAVQLANHEIGTLQDVAAIVARTRAQAPGAYVHCDAVQAAGKIPIRRNDLGVDFLALSFVRRAADVLQLRALMHEDCPAQIIAKMEKPEALENAEEILDVFI